MKLRVLLLLLPLTAAVLAQQPAATSARALARGRSRIAVSRSACARRTPRR